MLLLMFLTCFLLGGFVWLMFKLSFPIAIIGLILFAIGVLYRTALKMKEKEREDRGW